MSANLRHVAIDLGASSGRVATGVLDNGKLRVEITRRFPTKEVELQGHLYWNALAAWHEIREGLIEAAVECDISSVSVDCWAADFGLVSKSGDLVGNVHHYRDEWTNRVIPDAFEKVPREELYSKTGLQFASFNTVYQLLALLEASPELVDATDTLLFIPDLLHYWLTGVRVTEKTIASTSQLLDPQDGSWLADLMTSFGIPRRIFPAVEEPGTRLGFLAGGLRTLDGLAGAVVIAGAEHDTASAVAAVPADAGTDWCFVSSGTWSLVGTETLKPIINRDGLHANVTNEAGVHGTTRVIKNIMGLWMLQQSRRAWADVPLETLLQEAGVQAARFTLIDPNYPAFFAPGVDMPDRIADYCAHTGQTVPRTPGEFCRCILLSLAAAHADAVAMLENLVGHSFDVIHMVGGGSRNPLLCQWTSSAACKPVVAGPDEATLVGNLLVQCEAMDELDPSERREVAARSVSLIRYQPLNASFWEECLGRFRSLPRTI